MAHISSWGLYSYGLEAHQHVDEAARVERAKLCQKRVQPPKECRDVGLDRYGLYSYGVYSYGISSYGLYSYGLYSYGLYKSAATLACIVMACVVVVDIGTTSVPKAHAFWALKSNFCGFCQQSSTSPYHSLTTCHLQALTPTSLAPAGPT